MDHHDQQESMAESLAIEIEDAKKAGRLGFMARALIQATLPHKAAPSNEFVRDYGFFSLTIIAPSTVGLPYGSLQPLLLPWMTSEAVSRRQVLELGPTLSAFMAEPGLSRQGGKRGDITRFKKQAESLFCSTIHCSYADESRTDLRNLTIADEASLWWNPKHPDQLPLWKSTVTLTDKFFKEIIERPVPVDMVLEDAHAVAHGLGYLFLACLPHILPKLEHAHSVGAAARPVRGRLRPGPAGTEKLQDVLYQAPGICAGIYESAKVAPMERGFS